MSTLFTAIDAKVAEAKGQITAGKLRTASATLREVAELVSVAAEKEDGLLSDSTGAAIDPWAVTGPVVQAADLQMCARGVHAEGPIDSNGWRTCQACGRINLFPKADAQASSGPVQMR